jgi:hypothetical protein
MSTVETTTFDIWKARHDDLFRWFKELQQAYYDRTGIVYEPTELIRSRIAPTDGDKEWLRSIGIHI